MNPSTHLPATVLALVLAATVAACGGEPEVCADLDTLRSDLDDLGDIEVQPGSLADFSTAFDEVQTDVDQLVTDASSEYDDEVGAVRSALDALRSSVGAATESPSRATITQVSADFGAFASAVDELGSAVSGTC